jgi:hypothetical protein
MLELLKRRSVAREHYNVPVQLVPELLVDLVYLALAEQS